MKNVLMLLVLAGVAVSAAACNTVAGMGKDVERAGESIQKSTR